MKINRLNKIRELLDESESLSIQYLCDVFNVSKNTIRRDITELKKTGTIQTVYGGITLSRSDAPEPFAMREIKHQNQKKLIAKLASELVNNGDVIYIDSGTTTMHLIPYLAEKRNLTILTASVHVINAAFAYPQLNIIAAGGTLYRPSNAFVGSSVIHCLKNYNISKAFLASTAYSIANGATNASPLECEIKQYLTNSVPVKILLADSSKTNSSSLMTYCQLKDFDYIVTDQELPPDYTEYFQANNVVVLQPVV